MKKKLKTVFILIVLSLAGIIVFQSYWTFNSYKVNKERFDSNIDSAMRLAMEDCKKDYFDSMRVVLVKKLSPPETRIKIDTVYGKNTPVTYNIWLLGEHTKAASEHATNAKPFYPRLQHTMYMGPFDAVFSQKYHLFVLNKPNISEPKSEFDFYRKKINHKASLLEVLIEMSFYKRYLSSDITDFLTTAEVNSQLAEDAIAYSKMPKGSPMPKLTFTKGIYAFPKNYKQGDSSKLSRYLTAELNKMHTYASFNLRFSARQNAPQKPNIHYSETNDYPYKYHGFTGLGISFQDNIFFARAMFRNPQYAVLKSMFLTLVLSALLIALTIYCFLYITRTILEQKKLAELKDDFINNMTHELKTPIATMTVAIEGLQKFNALNDPEKTQRYLQTSRNELNRLNELVSKVLNMAVFENKEITLVKEKINVDEMVNDVISSEKTKTTKAVNITYTNKDVESIEADKFHFRNVLVNLVDNAIKYSDEPADISITCYKAGNNAVFSVKDKGIGIPPEHISQVFDKFHRVPTGNIHNVKGTGLGLSYVKYIVEAHGGSVIVKSEINTGSEFIVTLPLTNG